MLGPDARMALIRPKGIISFGSPSSIWSVLRWLPWARCSGGSSSSVRFYPQATVGFRPIADLASARQDNRMVVEISCASCGRHLTGDCEWGTEADYDRTCADKKPAVPKGRLIRLNVEDAVDVFQSGGIVGRKVYSEAGAIASNPEDILIDSLTSAGADNGCCGSDGCDGPNRACLCGSIVATQWSDCWTQAEVRFLPDAVRATEQAKSASPP